MNEVVEKVFEDSEELGRDFFLELARLKYSPLGQDLIAYLEMRIKRDLQHLIEVPPASMEAIAQLQARIAANGSLRALITADETIYEEEDEDAS